ncbi:MAG: hypothetical protein GY934_20495, partial [Gammaproteobacteria bacterium]|nr:hypothetical protein [Gammaproteobacteria bacterium]
MARLAAKEKVLFYPTPQEVMELIASNILTPASGPDDRVGTILDPCAGEGVPVAMLGHHLGLISYGCELHPERFAQAKLRLDHCLSGAREYLDIAGQFTVLFDNPPYDQTLEGHRMELDHIQLDLDLLEPDGVGIWVIPAPIISWDLCNLLVQHLKRINIRKFPEPFYEQFKQVVILGVKRGEPSTYTYTRTQELEREAKTGFADLSQAEFAYEINPIGTFIGQFEMNFPNVATVLDELETEGITTLDTWEALTSGTGQGLEVFQPILRLTSGHAAMAIAAGIVNGAEVEIEDEPYLIKGSTTKRLKVIKKVETEGEDTVETIREREQLVQQITAFNLD